MRNPAAALSAPSLVLVLMTGSAVGPQASKSPPPPIIDMHLHASSPSDFGGGAPNCADPLHIEYPGLDPKEPITFDRVTACSTRLPGAPSDEALMKESLARLERYNIWAVTSGPLDRVAAWRAAAPARIIPAISFAARDRTPAELRRLVDEGKVLEESWSAIGSCACTPCTTGRRSSTR